MATRATASVLLGLLCLCAARQAHADDSSVTVGVPDPPRDGRREEIRRLDDERPAPVAVEPEARRSPFRLQLGPAGITTGKGFGVGVGVGAEFGSGSVGGRLSAAWLRGEGKNGDGTSTSTGDGIGHYSGEITLDLHKRGPVHPVIGMGIGFLSISRPDTSGFAGTGTGRFALEYALGLDDADVRVGASVTGGIIGPVDSDVKDLRAYALTGLHLALGF